MMNRDTGRAMTEAEHIRQSIRDILTTPVGSRIMRRSYGSLIPDLIDQPSNPANLLRLQNASLMAILQHEPRVTAQSGRVVVGLDGSGVLDINLVRRGGARSGAQLNLSVPIR